MHACKPLRVFLGSALYLHRLLLLSHQLWDHERRTCGTLPARRLVTVAHVMLHDFRPRMERGQHRRDFCLSTPQSFAQEAATRLAQEQAQVVMATLSQNANRSCVCVCLRA